MKGRKVQKGQENGRPGKVRKGAFKMEKHAVKRYGKEDRSTDERLKLAVVADFSGNKKSLTA